MIRFTAIILGIFVTLASSFIYPANALAAPSPTMAALPIVKNIFAGTPPDNLGIHDGHLTKCPTSPNCVVSQGGDETHAIAPIPYQSDLATAKETLLKVLAVVPGTTIVEETDNYIRTESESRIMGFIDDAEFYFPVGENVIEIRSASRLGESDLGVNRRRLEQIRFALADLNV
ncbi:hypothetical protein Xen7305DRAFT_00050010 [Xenococcus sp. PCC 7305]|uniref:DUF1499 domain-containing protein n=1 Tax=Xenococcus sp. PCC 7305 TaxID=102125 RepID=UPI0002AC5E02|nr:DUF1499 domain-containing protein [Xenococcus sp. PCC 7305]ELS05258.1 hypothetical protein Xen7305DRAFT_00050010 [Xenococcus sp. PCC 7305]